MYLGREQTHYCVCEGCPQCPFSGPLVFAAAALHNITINDVGPVWCRLVNHLLIIALRALSPLPLSLYHRFSLSIAFFAFSIRTRSIGGRVGIGREASESALCTLCNCPLRHDTFRKDESFAFVYVCMRGSRDCCLDFLKSSCQCDSPLWESRGLHHVSGEQRGRVQSLCHPRFVQPAEALHHPVCHLVPPPQGERG